MKAATHLFLLLCLGGMSLTAAGQKLNGRLYNDQKNNNKWTAQYAPGPPKVIPINPPLPDAPEGKEWVPTFIDEFNGRKIDTKKWQILGDQKRKYGYWIKKNSTLDGKGNLVLKVDRQVNKDGKEEFHASGLQTRGIFEQAFGYYVCRYKMLRDNGTGYHCAFWLQSDGQGRVTDKGRDGTEIDIIEKFHHDDIIQHCLHWDGYGPEHERAKFSFPWPGIMDGFHTFAMKWTPKEYTFYVDGVETWRTKEGGVSQVPAFLRFTIEFSQGWNGDIHKAKLPDEFVVDYVRVYQAQ